MSSQTDSRVDDLSRVGQPETYVDEWAEFDKTFEELGKSESHEAKSNGSHKPELIDIEEDESDDDILTDLMIETTVYVLRRKSGLYTYDLFGNLVQRIDVPIKDVIDAVFDKEVLCLYLLSGFGSVHYFQHDGTICRKLFEVENGVRLFSNSEKGDLLVLDKRGELNIHRASNPKPIHSIKDVDDVAIDKANIIYKKKNDTDVIIYNYEEKKVVKEFSAMNKIFDMKINGNTIIIHFINETLYVSRLEESGKETSVKITTIDRRKIIDYYNYGDYFVVATTKLLEVWRIKDDVVRLQQIYRYDPVPTNPSTIRICQIDKTTIGIIHDSLQIFYLKVRSMDSGDDAAESIDSCDIDLNDLEPETLKKMITIGPSATGDLS